jgi:murein DD-endopeptidase MepM/ murein hydrolase activator NlpD
MVKVGDKVGSGQVIAKVGETGSVKEPQLHFELRRGRKPVDPREFLAPAPSTGGRVGGTEG